MTNSCRFLIGTFSDINVGNVVTEIGNTHIIQYKIINMIDNNFQWCQIRYKGVNNTVTQRFY